MTASNQELSESKRQAKRGESVWRRFERLILRPLFVFACFFLVLVAIFQASGRFALATAEYFTDEINAVLAPFGVRIEGLQGDWHGLNPIVNIGKVTFLGGSAKEVRFELDVLESAFNSAMVPRHVSVNTVYLDIVETDQGWKLRGAAEDGQLPDLTQSLRNVDWLEGSAEVLLTNKKGEVARVKASIDARNLGNQHYASLKLSAGNDDGLEINLWEQDADLIGEGHTRALYANGALALPELLTRQPHIELNVEDLSWYEVDKKGGGQLNLDLRRFSIPLETAELSLSLQAELSREEDTIRSVLPVLQIAGFAETEVAPFDLSGLQLKYAIDANGSDLENEVDVAVWHEGIELHNVTDFGRFATDPANAAGRWIRGLNPSGRLNNIHFFAKLLETPKIGFSGSLADLKISAFRGAPGLTEGQGQIWGNGRANAVQINASNGQLRFPDLFTDTWDFSTLQGVVKAWVAPGYFSLRGGGIKTRINDSNIAGSFSLTRPDPRYEQRVGMRLQVDGSDLMAARTFVPYKIPDDLSKWLQDGPQGGHLSNISFLYQGQVHVREGELGRRIELLSDLENASVKYDQEWPAVEGLDGQVHVAGTSTRVQVEKATSQDLSIGSSFLELIDNGTYAEVQMLAGGPGAKMLDFVLASPLQETLSFVTPEWQSSGDMRMSLDLRVPIRASEAPPLQITFDFDVQDFMLDMPEYRTRITDAKGSGKFHLPHQVTASLAGKMFGVPTDFEITSDDDWVKFDVTGQATHEDVYTLIDYEDVGIVDGRFDYEGVLAIAMNDKKVTNLAVQSDLSGMEVKLPSFLAKPASEPSPTEIDVQFLEDYQSIRWSYKDTQGWVHSGDEIERGAIGVSAAPPMTSHDQRAIEISGVMDTLVLSEWVSDDGDAQVALPLDWRIRGLRVGKFVIDDLEFSDLLLGGSQSGENVDFTFESPDLTGEVRLPEAGLMEIDLAHLRLPSTEEEGEVEQIIGGVSLAQAPDPIDVEVGRQLPASKVSLDLLHLDDEPFGSWRFTVRPEGNLVHFDKFTADVNGVHITDGAVVWDLERNRSSYVGDIQLDDLSETLPLWDYAPVVETSTTNLKADANWAGSPANISLIGLSGDLGFVARDGRFLDVEGGGGLRVMSLLNFSNIAKRISLDFTDVTDKGFGFDKIEAEVQLDEGHLQFVERMIVESTSSNFQVGGQVNLHTGMLDNEMIVTLPVSDSLPWYGVYLALANPLAGLGVIVGERVLRRPIQAFSTAKFEVTGSLDEPEVKFVSLWDQTMSDPETVQRQPLTSIEQ